MADGPFQRLRHFLRELKRRKVYRVAATYAVVGFVLIQLADLTFVRLGLPPWTVTLLIVLVAAGFPLAVILAWAFEVTPEGVRRTPETEPAEQGSAKAREGLSTGYKVLVGLGLVAAAVAGGWYLAAGSGDGISDRTVAVLPFETLGDTSSPPPVASGLHADLLTRLQRVSDLTVIARRSVMRYEDTEEPLARVARDLGARWLVTADVQVAGERVQVRPRLVDPRSGTERWSDSYRRVLSADSVFAVQSEITGRIVDALEARLTEGERARIGRQPTDSLEALQLYAEGRQQLARRRFTEARLPGEVVQDAVRNFREAIRMDSSFALAWAGLADLAALYQSDLYPREIPDSVTAPEVSQEEAARRALSLDPNLAEAHASLGFTHLQNQDAPAARRELRRALALKPSYWEAHHWLGSLYFRIGHPERALDHLKSAVELNPQHARARHLLYDAYLATGQAERSLEEARRQQRLGLEGVSAVGGEIRALYHLERYGDAEALAERQVEKLDDGATWKEILLSYLVVIRAAAGDTTEARGALERLRDHPMDPVVESWAEPMCLGWAYAALSDADRAFEAFGRLPTEAWKSLGLAGSLRYGIHFDRDRFRDDPRYRKLIRRANRSWGLEPDGSLPDSVDVSFETDD